MRAAYFLPLPPCSKRTPPTVSVVEALQAEATSLEAWVEATSVVDPTLVLVVVVLLARWAAHALQVGRGMAVLTGMVAVLLGMATTGAVMITITSFTITFTIASTTASYQLVSAGGGPVTMGMATAGARGCMIKRSIPVAPTGGIGITPASITTEEAHYRRDGCESGSVTGPATHSHFERQMRVHLP